MLLIEGATDMNSIRVIFPYKTHGTWVFDDAAHGLALEPFVFGVPEMIERVTAHLPNAENGFALYFSDKPFPRYQVELVRVREEYGGNWYRFDESDLEGWLCPALFTYFSSAPDRIYCRVERSS
jgi:hypothetical protein